MSFFLTRKQYEARTKTVTRRLGWANLKPGEQFMGVVKGQGIPKCGKIEKMHVSECVSNDPEPLNCISQEDVTKEGFPGMNRWEFIQMFCRMNKCEMDQIVNRIEFKHL